MRNYSRTSLLRSITVRCGEVTVQYSNRKTGHTVKPGLYVTFLRRSSHCFKMGLMNSFGDVHT